MCQRLKHIYNSILPVMCRNIKQYHDITAENVSAVDALSANPFDIFLTIPAPTYPTDKRHQTHHSL